MIQFDMCFTCQLIRIRVDFGNWTSEHRIMFPQGVFPEYVIHKIPVQGEIKAWGEKRNGERGTGGGRV